MNSIRPIFAAAVILLSGCSVWNDSLETVEEWTAGVGFSVSEEARISCEEQTARQLNGVDFSSPARIEMVIQRDEFSPMIVRLTKGKTYVLRIRNRDKEAHKFESVDFFDSIAINAVAMDNTLLETVCPSPGVTLQPGQTFEVQFLTTQDGINEFRDSSVSFGLEYLFDRPPPGGIIRIEENY